MPTHKPGSAAGKLADVLNVTWPDSAEMTEPSWPKYTRAVMDDEPVDSESLVYAWGLGADCAGGSVVCEIAGAVVVGAAGTVAGT